MTRVDFDYEVQDFRDLINICAEHDLEVMSDVVDPYEFDEFVYDEISNMRQLHTWTAVRDFLDGIEDDCEWYDKIEFRGLSQDDFEEYKVRVFDEMEYYNLFDDEDDDEDDETDEEESPEEGVSIDDVMSVVGAGTPA